MTDKMKTRDEFLIAQAAEDIGLSYREHTDECDRLAQRVLELERSGWQPPIDPDMIEAREYLATPYRIVGAHKFASAVMRGDLDHLRELKTYLYAIKRGRELERNGK